MSDAGWTDALLAIACVLAALRARSGAGAVGLGLVGLTAAAGAARFLVLEELRPAHLALVAISSALGLPLVGLGAARAAGWIGPRGVLAGVGLGAAALTAGALLGSGLPGTAAAAVGMVAAAVAGARARRPAGPIGAALVVVGGLAVAGEGTFGPLSRTAWFHLVMVVAVLALGQGLRRSRGRD